MVFNKILQMKNFLLFFIIIVNFLISNKLYSQEINLDSISNLSAILEERGVDQEELISRLNDKGIDIENMSESDILFNRTIIEKTILELEEEPLAGETVAEETLLIDFFKTSETIQEDENNDIELEEKDSIFNIKKEIKIYGHGIFSDKSSDVYRISKDASPPESYILASGDKINILIFGKSQANFVFEINEMGFIKPNKMPKIFIAGLSLKQAKQMLKKRFSDFYLFDEGEFAITLNTSRTISVNIFGEVFNSGSYTTSALNTLLSTLSIAGGPTDFGSVRNIQIIRANQKRILDVYDYMTNPSSQFDFFLQNNDIIYVPPIKKLINIEGAVNRPMAYELKDDEGIIDLLDFAGGLKVNAYTGLIQVETIEGDKKVLKDYSIDEIRSKDSNIYLKNGDKVMIKYIPEEFNDYVEILGQVNYTGLYPLNTTKTLSNLLDKAQVKPDTRIDFIYILREEDSKGTKEVISVDINENYDDILLMKQDRVILYNKLDYIDKFNISVTGEVRNPFDIDLSYESSISINDAIILAKGLKSNAANYGYVYRSSPFNLKETEYIPVNFENDRDFKLYPGDILVVLDKTNYKLESSVQITGDINIPTVLRYDESLTIRDLITIAGGFNISSDLNNIDVFRLDFQDYKTPKKSFINLKIDKNYNVIGNTGFKLRPYDVVVVRQIPRFENQEIISITGEVNKEGPFIINNKGYRFSDLIRYSNGFTDNADLDNIKLIRSSVEGIKSIVTFNAAKAVNNPKSKHDPFLVENDQIIVPEINNIVSINKLATNQPLHDFGEQESLKIVYAGNYSAKWYINNFAGGFSRNADRKSTSIIKANGKIKKTKKFLFFLKYPNVEPGDTISVLLNIEKLEKDQKEKKPFNWDNFTSKIISFATIYTLLQQTINQN